ncbi:MAG: DUF6273 domain-containing protein [Defluviitaleaceae bacterium]|nr:DUF6273 domain-containing protein [Defluviitaleaceae bacterium]
MKEEIDKVLENLMKNFGSDIFKDSNRFRAAILDEKIETNAKKIRFLLTLAICEMKVFTKLLTININTLVSEMTSEYEIMREASNIVIRSIAKLHNLYEPEEEIQESLKKDEIVDIKEIEKQEEITFTQVYTNPIDIPQNFINKIIDDVSNENINQKSKIDAKIEDDFQKPKNDTQYPKDLDIIYFGQYKWIVLKVYKNGIGLVISKDILFKMAYHNRKTTITWERSDIRKYLNSNFYEKFTVSEQKKIISKEVNNYFNEKYFTQGGKTTIDKIFLLSIEEAKKFFRDDTKRVAKIDNENTWWWLRSSGKSPDASAFVYSNGSISFDGQTSVYSYKDSKGINFVGYRIGGIRPAMEIDLSTVTVI